MFPDSFGVALVPVSNKAKLKGGPIVNGNLRIMKGSIFLSLRDLITLHAIDRRLARD